MDKKLLKGWTLIELLVVIAVMGILGTLGFINYQTFSATQKLNEGVSLVQNALRAAQANATSGLKCGGLGGAKWFVEFENNTTFHIRCRTPAAAASTQRSYTVPTDIAFGINTCGTDVCLTSCAGSRPFSVIFSPLFGAIDFESPSSCVASKNTFYIKLFNTKTNEAKSVSVSKGGRIDAGK